MKNNIKCNFFSPFLNKSLLTILGGLALASCGSVPEGYTEADGIYYDPSVDKLERITMRETPNQVGERYEYHTESESSKIIEQAVRNQEQQAEKYKNWGGEKQNISSSSDWGTYTGTQNNYYNNYSWGYPYYYNGVIPSPYFFGGYNSYFGSRYNYGWSLGFSWGSPYYYNPYGYGYYNPWYYNNYYSPYYYSPYNYYPPYRGRYYEPYYRYNTPQRNYRRSDEDPIYRGRVESNRNYNNTNRSNNYNNRGYNWGGQSTERDNSWRNSPSNIGNRDSNWNRNQQPTQRDNSWRNSSSDNGNRGNSGGFRRAGGF